MISILWEASLWPMVPGVRSPRGLASHRVRVRSPRGLASCGMDVCAALLLVHPSDRQDLDQAGDPDDCAAEGGNVGDQG